MEERFYRIPIVAIEKPIQEATTLSFHIPEEYSTIFKFYAGQYLCFRFFVNEKEALRMYSLHNSPYNNELYQVTVKRQDKGLVSNYISEHLKVGDFIEISKPLGDFKIHVDSKAQKCYYLFAAGSGITPIYSMIKSILLMEPLSQVFLLYGNRSLSDILFYEELMDWKSRFPDKFHITHTLSKRFLDFSQTPWDGKRGRIDEEMLENFIRENPSDIKNSEYFSCGPGEMNQMIQKCLINRGVSSKFIHSEYFLAPEIIDEQKEESLAKEADVSARIGSVLYQLDLKIDETILEGLKRIGAPAPYFCQSGICGTCKAHLKDGEVKMKSSMALSADERKKRMILTCQSQAISSKVKIEFK
ncbi:2Fe-2S iron-sulfur cluster-binding protein [Labilibaculum sp.]|uniref:2Fe-2S iron-sulfur cluster-binding protein n=1 Tax=Labilibaculum sp. TaxID=2060723 RepID=UPI0035694CC8